MSKIEFNLELHLRKAVKKLEESRSELAALKNAKYAPIAIVGMSCRFPGGANSNELYWDKLNAAVPLTSDIPSSRWDVDSYFSAEKSTPGKMYTKKAGFIDDIDMFDAAFFNISRREAQLMDPQQRLLLEETWQALEVAGIPADKLNGSNTGVYIGCGSHDYINHLSQSSDKTDISGYFGTGNSSSVIAGRIAYYFGFNGPVFTLDTACSSSLVAIHQACMALRDGECSLAVAGGVNAILTPDVMINFCKANMLSEDGLCKAFDSRADGYARGEGVGVLILKRLEDAKKDNDNILACIVGDAINHDGPSSSLTSPNGDAQVRLIRDTLQKFKIDPASIDYIEAHGTGTSLGDPIEANALNTVFAGSHSDERPLYLGSVKTNIGHLEAAAGVAGVIKVVLSILHGQIPAHLNFRQMNPLIDNAKVPLKIPTKKVEWSKSNSAKRASISSFGFSGTNAYIVLEEYTREIEMEHQFVRDCIPLFISAKTSQGLKDRIDDLENVLRQESNLSLADICHTINSGRSKFDHYLYLTCKDKADMLEKLKNSESLCKVMPVKRDALLLIQIGKLAEAEAFLILKSLYRSIPGFYRNVNAICQKHAIMNIETLLKVPFQSHLFGEHIDCADILTYSLLSLLGEWKIYADYLIPDSLSSWVFEDYVTKSDSIILDRAQVSEMAYPFFALDLFDTGVGINHSRLIGSYTVAQDGCLNMERLFEALGHINTWCGDVDWQLLDSGYTCHKVALPVYPFNKKRYWYTPKVNRTNMALTFTHPFFSRQLNTPHSKFQYVAIVNSSKHEFLIQHSIYQQILLPASAFVDMLKTAIQHSNMGNTFEIYDFEILSPLRLHEDQDVTLIVEINDTNAAIHYLPDANLTRWVKLVTASYRDLATQSQAEADRRPSNIAGKSLPYDSLARNDIIYGEKFQSVHSIVVSDSKCIAEIVLKLDKPFALIGLLDGVFQSVGGFLLSEIEHSTDYIYLPHSFDVYQQYQPLDDTIHAYLKLVEKTDRYCLVDIEVYTKNNVKAVVIKGYRAIRVLKSALIATSDTISTSSDKYVVSWVNDDCSDARLAVAYGSTSEHIFIDLSDANLNADLTRSLQWLQLQISKTIEDKQLSKASLVFITRNAVSVNDSEAIPSQAFFHGLIKSLRLEYSPRKVYSIDIDAEVDELLYLPKQGFDLALRNGKTYYPIIERYKQKTTPHQIKQKPYSIIITGGTSSICMTIAESIIMNDRNAVVILVARNERPESEQFISLLKSDRVHFISCDLTDKQSVFSLINDINIHLPTLTTVVHGAGVLRDGLFSTLSTEMIATVLNVKLLPLPLILRACQDVGVTLEDVVALSSISSTLGSHGQSHYAAANAYLEAYVQTLRKQGLNATAVALSPVTGSGMAEHSLILKRFPFMAISLKSAAESVVNSISNKNDPIYSVFNPDFVRYLKSHKLYQSQFHLNDISSEAKLEHIVNLSNVERISVIKQYLIAELRRILELQEDEINETSGFFELGMDSLMAIELFESLQAALGDKATLSTTMIFDLPNVSALTDYIVSSMFPSKSDTLIAEKTCNDTDMNQEPIAIIGMACRFPGDANSVEKFWDNLCHGVDSVGPVPKSRWDHAAYFDEKKSMPGKIYTTQAHFIKDYDLFDANFFSLTPKELENIDPQQRLLLELTYSAFESALMPIQHYKNSKTGVFIGHFTNDYGGLITKYALDSEINAYSTLGNSASTASGRISYQFGFNGPSFPINTACSSSLIAAHLACRSLRQGECDIAVVGGVNLMLAPEIMINISQAHMLSTDGRCYSFDVRANGYGRGEGAGVILLKRLSDAIKDRDIIEAVILASSTNQDGASSALTVPNGKAQEDLLQDALNQSGLDPSDIAYIEAHGTGTALGDPIEMNAINRIYRGSHNKDTPLYVSTVKTNIGHLEAAAGVAAMIKTAMTLKHKIIPPHLHLTSLNPAIDLAPVPVSIPTRAIMLNDGKPNVAGVSSFGFSGSNAHLLMREPPVRMPIDDECTRSIYLTKLSAKSVSALRHLIDKTVEFLEGNEPELWSDYSYSANIGRDDYDFRCTVISYDRNDFVNKIKSSILHEHQFEKQKIVWLFDGCQRTKLSADLLKEAPEINRIFKSVMDAVTQPDLHDFAVKYAIGCYFIGLGVIPDLAYARGIDIFPLLALSEKIPLEQAAMLSSEATKQLNGEENHYHINVKAITLQPGKFPVQVDNGNSTLHTWLSDVENLNIDLSQSFISDTVRAVILNMDDIISNNNQPVLALYEKISRCYQAGCQLDWISFEKDFIKNKITLPGYPFNRLSYISPVVNRMHDKDGKIELLDQSLLYETNYYPLLRDDNNEVKSASYLIIYDSQETRNKIHKEIEGNNHDVIADIHVADLTNFCENKLKEVLSGINKPLKTIYLASFEREADASLTELMDFVQLDTMFIKQYLKTVIDLKLDHRFYYITVGANHIKNGLCSLSSASVVGLLKAINFEYASLNFINIDYSSQDDTVQTLRSVYSESAHESSETLVVYRNGQRYVPRLEQIKQDISQEDNPTRINPEKSYIITGGLGGLGLSLCQSLLQLGAKHIHLLSRRVPDRELSIKLASWCIDGAAVYTHSVDLTNKEALFAVMNEIVQGDHPLDGVFHLAGVDDRAAFVEYDWARFKNVLDAKISGAWYLHDYTRHLTISYFVLFSSIASSVGSARQAPYVTANAFLDGLAQLRKQLELPAQTINWGPWSESGMVGGEAKILSDSAGSLLSENSALAVFQNLLTSGISQYTVVQPTFLQFLLRFYQDNIPMFLSRVSMTEAASLGDSDVVTKLKNALQDEYLEIIENYLLAIFIKVTGSDGGKSLDLNAGFFDMGVDSLMAIEMAEYCRKDFETIITLPPTLLFESTSLGSLAAYITERVKIALTDSVNELEASNNGYTENDIRKLSLDDLDAIISGNPIERRVYVE